ncbi:MAG: DNA alkylation repair protein [Bacteriovoracaceae bacterium]|jgi:3-methyladenine DNA glycosylase AlkD|nr:DNA alkylation repair protein [Bacteriovoracaceae bacterium]
MKNLGNLEKYHLEVTKIYLNSGKPLNREREKYLQENNYKTKYRLYNLDEKKFSKSIGSGYSFSDYDFKDQARIWSYIFKKTQYMGIGHLAISHFKKFQAKKTHSLYQYWPLLKTWAASIENWAHADMLASIYCDILSEAPDKVYPEFKKWSKQRSPWKNRMAIVSLLYYYNPKRVLLKFEDIIALVLPHLKNNHYYLQKAIGWNLRELSRAYPKEYWKFLNKNLLDLSPVAFSTATEKVSKDKKVPLKLKRKEARKLNRGRA